MENEISNRRRLFVILVVITVMIFIGLVWLIAARLPGDVLGLQNITPTTSGLVAQDCTYPIGYWQAHPELYPAQLIIGGVAYQERELDALLADDSQETAQGLKAQLAVTFLNGQVGADQSAIEASVFAAYDWLVLHPSGSQVSEVELQKGQQLLAQLDAYNQGLGGVQACQASLAVTRTSTRPAMGTQQASVTPSLTATQTASEIPATSNTFSVPTNTATRTTEPPVVQPTNTEITPTERPAPTNTPRPPDTATIAPPPPPTATNTLPPLPTATTALPPPPPPD